MTDRRLQHALGLRWSAILSILPLFLPTQPCNASAPLSCVQAAAVVEAEAGIPSGLLLAIGTVESGRPDAAGTRTPWPFAVQAGGMARYPANADDAIAEVQALQRSGLQSIDIGCFQINLFHHPHAFSGLAEGFDPLANAHAAAKFLLSLHGELGAWQPAVAAYHSRNAAIGWPYRDAVLASWHGILPAATGVYGTTIIRIWGPNGEIDGNAVRSVPQLVSMTAVPTAAGLIRMPRRFTIAWTR